MNLQVKSKFISALLAKRSAEIFYPESDGKPLAETDTHRDLINQLISSLQWFFENLEDVYVTGNIMFYYVEGATEEVVSPDVMVCFGVEKGNRRSYKTWEENDVVPSVVIEISSRSTWRDDRTEKRLLYEQLGVKEYYIFNPQFPKSLPAFIAFRLEEGELKSVKIENGRVLSEALQLELVEINKTLRLYNPQTNNFLLTNEELAEENAKLKAEIERLKQLLKNQEEEI